MFPCCKHTSQKIGMLISVFTSNPALKSLWGKRWTWHPNPVLFYVFVSICHFKFLSVQNWLERRSCHNIQPKTLADLYLCFPRGENWKICLISWIHGHVCTHEDNFAILEGQEMFWRPTRENKGTVIGLRRAGRVERAVNNWSVLWLYTDWLWTCCSLA